MQVKPNCWIGTWLGCRRCAFDVPFHSRSASITALLIQTIGTINFWFPATNFFSQEVCLQAPILAFRSELAEMRQGIKAIERLEEECTRGDRSPRATIDSAKCQAPSSRACGMSV